MNGAQALFISWRAGAQGAALFGHWAEAALLAVGYGDGLKWDRAKRHG